jgi:hypothetical protein
MSELDAQMQGLHPAWYDKKKEMDETLQGLTAQANGGAVSHERMQQVMEMSKAAAKLFPEPRSSKEAVSAHTAAMEQVIQAASKAVQPEHADASSTLPHGSVVTDGSNGTAHPTAPGSMAPGSLGQTLGPVETSDGSNASTGGT